LEGKLETYKQKWLCAKDEGSEEAEAQLS